MPRFNFHAVTAEGVDRSGQLEAADIRQVSVLLREQGLFPVEVLSLTETKTAPLNSGSSGQRERAGEKVKSPRRSRVIWPFGKRIKAKELAVFTRQLATLLKAGMPLLRTLEVLSRQERSGPLHHVLVSLADVIKSGGSLSDAMAHHPRVFDKLYLSMIKAGEAGGVLDVVLERLARFQEKSIQLKGKITAAMVYPLIVMGVALIILAGLMIVVVPKFKQIFADLLKGAPLPPLTQFVLTMSDAVKSHYLIATVISFLLWVGIKYLARTAHGVRVIDGLIIKLPLFGELFLKAIIARFGRTLGTLLASGVPILPALLITRDTAGNARVAMTITGVHDRVKEGSSVARPLEAAKIFPPMVTSMMDVGEHTGQMPEMLNKVADIYEDEVDSAVAGLSSLIEPVMILFLAIMVGTIVIALFLPIVRIVQLLT